MRKVDTEPGFANSLERHLKQLTKAQKVVVSKDYHLLIDLLKRDAQDIPSRYKVHKLKNKGGLFEAHLGGRGSDTLILFRKELVDGIPTLTLVRVCTHYQLDLIKAMAEYEDAVITAAYMFELLD